MFGWRALRLRFWGFHYRDMTRFAGCPETAIPGHRRRLHSTKLLCCRMSWARGVCEFPVMLARSVLVLAASIDSIASQFPKAFPRNASRRPHPLVSPVRCLVEWRSKVTKVAVNSSHSVHSWPRSPIDHIHGNEGPLSV